jgi:hypothetical protein
MVRLENYLSILESLFFLIDSFLLQPEMLKINSIKSERVLSLVILI